MENKEEKKDWKKWLKNLGIGGIIFFTVKGLITTYLITFQLSVGWCVKISRPTNCNPTES